MTRTNAYETLLKENHPKIEFWQKPGFVICGFIVAFDLGALLVGSHCFGLCK